MKNILRPLAGTLFCVWFTSCGGGGFTTPPQSIHSPSPCPVDPVVLPATATADHTASPPGNQVQFSAVVEWPSPPPPGVCPQIIAVGSWTTSDPVNTSISNQPATAGLATCLNATPSPATIGYTDMAFGKPYTSATLTCE